jgi:hypothetical protein
MPVIPVFLGSIRVPNITKTPSYIHARDFRNPQELGKYLLFLNQNPKQMEAYFAWKKDPSQFTDEYLDLVHEQMPGPKELKLYLKNVHEKEETVIKMAMCCRLCDPALVKKAAGATSQRTFVHHKLNNDQIRNQFFQT